jgi:L-Ala-D/L-Glu epimerase
MTLRVQLSLHSWPLREAFEISREVIHQVPVLHLVLQNGQDGQGQRGQAEAAGVDYDGETPASMAAQIQAITPRLRADTSAAELAQWLPAGGARNAIDCALWDLRAKTQGLPAWQLAALPRWQAVTTAATIGLGDEAETRRRAHHWRDMPLLKLKLDAQRHRQVLRAVREEAPAARLIVDANQAWTLALLDQLMPDLQAAGVGLIEQPLPRGEDAGLLGFASPIPLAADESCTDLASLDALLGRYQAINVKLDKCGGLSEALQMVRWAQAHGLALMVGNMCGSSLAMAPAFLVAQHARWVDLDGPLLQHGDHSPAMRYEAGLVQAPEPALWG